MTVAAPDPIALQTYIDLWVVRHGQEWTPVTETMLIDNECVEGRMTRALAGANLLEQHYMADRMEFVAKIKQGV